MHVLLPRGACLPLKVPGLIVENLRPSAFPKYMAEYAVLISFWEI